MINLLCKALVFFLQWLVTHILEALIKWIELWGLRDREIVGLEDRLKAKYSGTIFTVAPDSTSKRSLMFDLAADVIQKEIDEFFNANKGRNVVVAVVGGVAIREIVQSLWLRKKKLDKRNWKGLWFIPLNQAGDPEYYHFSANYLAVSLSEIFPGSSHLVPASNWNHAQRKEYNDLVNGLDLLICSAGSRDGFLSEWLQKKMPPLALPPHAIGDFCLFPIAPDGYVITDDNAIERAIAQLSPHPKFKELSEVRGKCRRVILPITAHYKYYTSHPGGNETATEKDQIARTLLSSGIVDHCILNKTLAKNILL